MYFPTASWPLSGLGPPSCEMEKSAILQLCSLGPSGILQTLQFKCFKMNKVLLFRKLISECLRHWGWSPCRAPGLRRSKCPKVFAVDLRGPQGGRCVPSAHLHLNCRCQDYGGETTFRNISLVVKKTKTKNGSYLKKKEKNPTNHTHKNQNPNKQKLISITSFPNTHQNKAETSLCWQRSI